jgi:hypothetical protein
MVIALSYETRRKTADPSDEGIDDTVVSLSHARGPYMQRRAACEYLRVL